MPNLVRLDDDSAGRDEEPLACVRRAVWSMIFYANDACIGSRSAEGLDDMMAVIVMVFKAEGLVVSE